VSAREMNLHRLLKIFRSLWNLLIDQLFCNVISTLILLSLAQCKKLMPKYCLKQLRERLESLCRQSFHISISLSRNLVLFYLEYNRGSLCSEKQIKLEIFLFFLSLFPTYEPSLVQLNIDLITSQGTQGKCDKCCD